MYRKSLSLSIVAILVVLPFTGCVNVNGHTHGFMWMNDTPRMMRNGELVESAKEVLITINGAPELSLEFEAGEILIWHKPLPGDSLDHVHMIAAFDRDGSFLQLEQTPDSKHGEGSHK